MPSSEFSKTIGHGKQKGLFLEAIKNGALGHAYAFCGPEHIGKTTFALDLADTLGADPLLDVVLFDDEQGKEFPIEEARVLQNRLSLTPAGKLKVAIIAGAEKMTVSASNSLLKVLEEPPAHSLLLLLTANFYAMLPTIASRVQKVNFGLLSPAEMQTGLLELPLVKPELEAIIALAPGRLGLGRLLAANPQLLEFYRMARAGYEVLENGLLYRRLQTAAELSGLKTPALEEFLKFAMASWVAESRDFRLAQKLQAAWHDLEYNLNTKLLMDNLFLPLT